MNVSFSVFNNDEGMIKNASMSNKNFKITAFFSPLIIRRSQNKRIIDLELRKRTENPVLILITEGTLKGSFTSVTLELLICKKKIILIMKDSLM